ncbi:AAA domain-containing protein [Desarmillaria tabescens]|uniref:AAA domain-containing protein n=1 Tax=Armillaria tabescens TaxID=1929756 RepID=A0AA39K394_ARMTA|nr:AAA domain-containing protein [Desarmillaria tabescens]KAK0451423.1 AAA domain-containing protein [Desarmillaria tabescens]
MERMNRPLVGDSQGRYRIHIVGNCGTGKSTLAKKLSQILGIPYISLDTIFWRPDWEQTPNEEFQSLVSKTMDDNPNGWIIDGNYQQHIGKLVQNNATDIIWLDPPFLLYFPRVLVRTFLRLFGLGTPCSPGCRESFREVFFSRNSILCWCWWEHRVHSRTGRSPHERNRARSGF